MHELALMEEVLRIALAAAAAQGARRILAVKLSVGRLSGVNPGALAFAFEVVMAAGAAAGAQLELEVVPTVCRCGACGRHFEPVDVIYACPECGCLSADVLAGRELELTGLEVS
ncbi:hydrogenase maturation nickel metallochaperone HypA [Synechococcus sp. CS-1325]|uniref:hydrogenase maturation nickel metallochaperone HypA n=1 Tax=Synechococcus sp. CS-1325 TaxID=2847979 RepID=UPI000DB08DB2|nr:hydrogenase maturation nickel metallochaperone HypA [Synechococcus sp. CS-1325]MCT0198344.1 hydrogenase maturation nickel metallochaperone HypA [Synechococcus sp. CS-1325]PZV00202.1 MAG: hydrogenase maturation nickel metallochaperone HypA [Cyanobium sp.]